MTDSIRERVFTFWQRHREKGKKKTVDHFKQEGWSRSYIYELIMSIEQDGQEKQAKKRGPKPNVMSRSEKDALRRVCEGKVCPSFKKLAKKFKCSDKTMKKRLESIGLVRMKRKTVPEVSPVQEITQWYRVRRLNRSLKNEWKGFDIVMDDESYFHLSNDAR